MAPIWESAAITMYLGEMFGVDAGLYPPPGPRRGEAMKWIVWANVNVAEAAGRLAAAMPAGSEGAVEPPRATGSPRTSAALVPPRSRAPTWLRA